MGCLCLLNGAVVQSRESAKRRLTGRDEKRDLAVDTKHSYTHASLPEVSGHVNIYKNLWGINKSTIRQMNRVADQTQRWVYGSGHQAVMSEESKAQFQQNVWFFWRQVRADREYELTKT